RQGLGDTGLAGDRNPAIEYRFAENRNERLPALATELANRKVAAIAATGGGNSIFAAKAATTTIPIVFVTAGDPIHQGYVSSLNRPGGNITGINWFGSQLAAKGLGMLRELVPKASIVGLLVNPKLPETQRTRSDAEDAARALGLRIVVLNASTPVEIDDAFAS